MAKRGTGTTVELQNIVETAITAGSFSVLAEALKAAGLVDTLSYEGPFTVFAPSDHAFDKLEKSAVKDLLGNKTLLRKILTFHVVAGKMSSKEIASRESLPSIQGQELSIDTSDVFMVGNAQVIKADIPCSNGVIHVIDTVLMPH